MEFGSATLVGRCGFGQSMEVLGRVEEILKMVCCWFAPSIKAKIMSDVAMLRCGRVVTWHTGYVFGYAEWWKWFVAGLPPIYCLDWFNTQNDIVCDVFFPQDTFPTPLGQHRVLASYFQLPWQLDRKLGAAKVFAMMITMAMGKHGFEIEHAIYCVCPGFVFA